MSRAPGANSVWGGYTVSAAATAAEEEEGVEEEEVVEALEGVEGGGM